MSVWPRRTVGRTLRDVSGGLRLLLCSLKIATDRVPLSAAPTRLRSYVLTLFLCLLLPKTDKVTTFELSGCLDGRALQGFSPKTSLDRICSHGLWVTNSFVSIIGDG